MSSPEGDPPLGGGDPLLAGISDPERASLADGPSGGDPLLAGITDPERASLADGLRGTVALPSPAGGGRKPFDADWGGVWRLKVMLLLLPIENDRLLDPSVT